MDAKADLLFRIYDKDGDGFLSLGELQVFVTKFISIFLFHFVSHHFPSLRSFAKTCLSLLLKKNLPLSPIEWTKNY